MSAAPIPGRRIDTRVRTMITPEGLALPITLASRGARAGALFIDFAIIWILIIATTVALLWIGGGAASVLQQAQNRDATSSVLQFLIILWAAVMFLFRYAYFLFFELGPRGATPGKRIVGIRIAARDGGRLTVEMVVARNLLRDIELFLPVVLLMTATGEGTDGSAAGLAATAWFLIFALFPFFNRDRLRAGDVIAGSWVVERPKRKLEAVLTGSHAPRAEPRAVRHTFSDADLSVYGEYELQTLERVLRENRKETLRTVYGTICGKIGWTAGEGDEREFLEDYYVQLRAHLESRLRMGQRKTDKFG